MELRMLIGGDLVVDRASAGMEIVEPATEHVIGTMPLGTSEDMERAVSAADAAFPGWWRLGVTARVTQLRGLGAAIADRADEIAQLEAADTGNIIRAMRNDVIAATRLIEYFAGLGLEQKGETVPATAGHLHFSRRRPFGVVGRITAFNHPFYFAVTALTAPLVAGNTVVIKPSEQAGASTLLLAELCCDLFPAGVVNIVTGGAAAGEALVRSPVVKRIGFTGSMQTGMSIQRAAAESAVKNVSLELGGKNPMIVFPDVNISEVAEAVVRGMNLGCQGQSCGSLSRLLLHTEVHEDIVQLVAAKLKDLHVGNPLSELSEMGPLISSAHRERVDAHVNRAIAEGADLVVGGGPPQGPDFERGYWYSPTVLAGVTSDMAIFSQEVFGPVLAISEWSDEDDVVRLANSVAYGLTASVWTGGLSSALRTAEAIEAGVVLVNEVAPHFVGAGFGGLKNSGVGREESLSELLSYTEEQWFHVFL